MRSEIVSNTKTVSFELLFFVTWSCSFHPLFHQLVMMKLIGPLVVIFCCFVSNECFSGRSGHPYTIFSLSLMKESPRNALGYLSMRFKSPSGDEEVQFHPRAQLYLSDAPMHQTLRLRSVASQSTVQLKYTQSDPRKASFIVLKTLHVADDQRGQSFNLCASSFLATGKWISLQRC